MENSTKRMIQIVAVLAVTAFIVGGLALLVPGSSSEPTQQPTQQSQGGMF